MFVASNLVDLSTAQNLTNKTVPTPTTASQIANKSYADSNFCALTGDQIIAGIKTFSGTVSGITPTMVGLGNVNNTTDMAKPVSTLTQSALDLKVNTTAMNTALGSYTTLTYLSTSLSSYATTTAMNTALSSKAPKPC